MIEITSQVTDLCRGAEEGIAILQVAHTTAGLTINENADPDVQRDMLLWMAENVPKNYPGFRHEEGNSDAHIKASLMGAGLTLPIAKGQLALGTWQGIYFCEFDGPRSRKVWLKIVSG